MADTKTGNKGISEQIEAAILDADLFVKYGSPRKAIERLHEAIALHPRVIAVREKLREICAGNNMAQEAARQCLLLARLYIENDNLDAAHERLIQAREMDPRVSITPGLEAIRRARRLEPESKDLHRDNHSGIFPGVVLTGSLDWVSIFDVIQVVENSRMTGDLTIAGRNGEKHVHFNQGKIVGAAAENMEGESSFRSILETSSGSFSFAIGAESSVDIQVSSNTSLMLETLRKMDEAKG